PSQPAMQERVMYKGAAEIILKNGLSYQDVLPVAFKPLAQPMDMPANGELTDRNVRVMQVCAVLEEQGSVEKKDESSPAAADVMRLVAMVNLLLDLVGQLLAAQLPRPVPALVRSTALGALARSGQPPRVGRQDVLELQQ